MKKYYYIYLKEQKVEKIYALREKVILMEEVENATVPVIETGVGNCHLYVEKTADPEMAEKITVNAKTSRISVCNAAESLLVDEAVAVTMLPRLKKALDAYKVTLYGCPKTRAILLDVEEATEEDYDREYLDYKMSVPFEISKLAFV